MARAIWSGSISFGLVNVPVKLYSAVHQQDLHFNQFDKSGNHIRYKRVSEKTGREVDGAKSKDASVSKREVDMAAQIIDSLTTEWDPAKYHDTYREQVLGLLKKKAEGEEIVVEEEAPEEGQVLDLMAALEASLAEA